MFARKRIGLIVVVVVLLEAAVTKAEMIDFVVPVVPVVVAFVDCFLAAVVVELAGRLEVVVVVVVLLEFAVDEAW